MIVIRKITCSLYKVRTSPNLTRSDIQTCIFSAKRAKVGAISTLMCSKIAALCAAVDFNTLLPENRRELRYIPIGDGSSK